MHKGTDHLMNRCPQAHVGPPHTHTYTCPHQCAYVNMCALTQVHIHVNPEAE